MGQRQAPFGLHVCVAQDDIECVWWLMVAPAMRHVCLSNPTLPHPTLPHPTPPLHQLLMLWAAAVPLCCVGGMVLHLVVESPALKVLSSSHIPLLDLSLMPLAAPEIPAPQPLGYGVDPGGSGGHLGGSGDVSGSSGQVPQTPSLGLSTCFCVGVVRVLQRQYPVYASHSYPDSGGASISSPAALHGAASMYDMVRDVPLPYARDDDDVGWRTGSGGQAPGDVSAGERSSVLRRGNDTSSDTGSSDSNDGSDTDTGTGSDGTGSDDGEGSGSQGSEAGDGSDSEGDGEGGESSQDDSEEELVEDLIRAADDIIADLDGRVRGFGAHVRVWPPSWVCVGVNGCVW